MTPDRILHALGTANRLPREAMAAARERREEMTPLFLEQIDRLQTATDDTNGNIL